MKDYKKILEGVVDIINTTEKSDIGFANICSYIGENCPELKESEDERIRKEIINYLHGRKSNETYGEIVIKYIRWIEWLEKQGSEPNWCHHKVDLSDCSEEYRKAYYDGWNNCNMQHSQCKSELDDVVKCLINGMKFYYEENKEATWGTDKWSMPVKHIIEVLEKQGEQKLTPKFRVGDKIWHKNYKGECIHHIIRIENDNYIGDDNTSISISTADKEYELVEKQGGQKPTWSEEDERMKNQFVDFMLSGIDISKAPYGCVAWLKSLRPQSTWKPSDEQMNALHDAAVYVDKSMFPYPKGILMKLYKQLKKLREE